MALPDNIDPTLARLIETHPALFRGRAPRVASFVPAGWYGLVDRLFTSIEHMLGPERGSRFRVDQIKEKFGTLRLYCGIDEDSDVAVDLIAPDGHRRLTQQAASDNHERRMLRELVSEAERESAVICSRCGACGELCNLAGWAVVLCDAHRAEKADKIDGLPG